MTDVSWSNPETAKTFLLDFGPVFGMLYNARMQEWVIFSLQVGGTSLFSKGVALRDASSRLELMAAGANARAIASRGNEAILRAISGMVVFARSKRPRGESQAFMVVY